MFSRFFPAVDGRKRRYQGPYEFYQQKLDSGTPQLLIKALAALAYIRQDELIDRNFDNICRNTQLFKVLPKRMDKLTRNADERRRYFVANPVVLHSDIDVKLNAVEKHCIKKLNKYEEKPIEEKHDVIFLALLFDCLVPEFRKNYPLEPAYWISTMATLKDQYLAVESICKQIPARLDLIFSYLKAVTCLTKTNLFKKKHTCHNKCHQFPAILPAATGLHERADNFSLDPEMSFPFPPTNVVSMPGEFKTEITSYGDYLIQEKWDKIAQEIQKITNVEPKWRLQAFQQLQAVCSLDGTCDGSCASLFHRLKALSGQYLGSKVLYFLLMAATENLEYYARFEETTAFGSYAYLKFNYELIAKLSQEDYFSNF